MNRGRRGGNFRPAFRGGVSGRGGAFSTTRRPMRGFPQFIGRGNSSRGFQHGNQFQGRPQDNSSMRDSGPASVSTDPKRGCRPGFKPFPQGNVFSGNQSGSPVDMQRQGMQDMNQLNERFGRQSLNEPGQGDYVFVERRGRAGHIQRGLVRVRDTRGSQGFNKGRGFVKPRNIGSGSPTVGRYQTSRGSSSSPNLSQGFARQRDGDSPSGRYRPRNRSNSPSLRQGRGQVKPRDNSNSPSYIRRRQFSSPVDVGLQRPRTDSKDREKMMNKVPKDKKQQASWIPLEEDDPKKPEETKSTSEKQKSSPEKQTSSPEKQKSRTEKMKPSLEKREVGSSFVSEDETSGKVVESLLHEKFGDFKDTTNRGACSAKGEGVGNNNNRTVSSDNKCGLETVFGENSRLETVSGERKGNRKTASGERKDRSGTVSGVRSRRENSAGERKVRHGSGSCERRNSRDISFGERRRTTEFQIKASNRKETFSRETFSNKHQGNIPGFNRREDVGEQFRHIGHISRRDAALFSKPRRLVRSHSDESEYCFDRHDRRSSPEFERMDAHSRKKSFVDISSPDPWRHVSNDTKSSSNEGNRRFESISPSKYSHSRSLSRDHRSNSGERRYETSFSRFEEYHSHTFIKERSISFERRRNEPFSGFQKDNFERFSRTETSSSGERRNKESFSSFKKHHPSSISRSSSGERRREESSSSLEKFHQRSPTKKGPSNKEIEDISLNKLDPSNRSALVERRRVTASVSAFQKYLSKSLKPVNKKKPKPKPKTSLTTSKVSKDRIAQKRFEFSRRIASKRLRNGWKRGQGSRCKDRCDEDKGHYGPEKFHNYNRMKTDEKKYDPGRVIFVSSDSDASAARNFGQKIKDSFADLSRSRKRMFGKEMFDRERPMDRETEDRYHPNRQREDPESFQLEVDDVLDTSDQREDLYDPWHPLETKSDQREEMFEYNERERLQESPKENVEERKTLFDHGNMSDISSDSEVEGSKEGFQGLVSQQTSESVKDHFYHKNSLSWEEADCLTYNQDDNKSNWQEPPILSTEDSSDNYFAKTMQSETVSGTESQSQDNRNEESYMEKNLGNIQKQSLRKGNFVSSCLKEGYSTFAYEDDRSSSEETKPVKTTKPKIYIDFRKAPIRRFSKDMNEATRKSLDDSEIVPFQFGEKATPQDVLEVQKVADVDSNDCTSSIGDIHELLEKSYNEKSSISKDKVAKYDRPYQGVQGHDDTDRRPRDPTVFKKRNMFPQRHPKDSFDADIHQAGDKMRKLSSERQREEEKYGSSDSESSESSTRFTRTREKRLSSGSRRSRKKSGSSFSNETQREEKRRGSRYSESTSASSPEFKRIREKILSSGSRGSRKKSSSSFSSSSSSSSSSRHSSRTSSSERSRSRRRSSNGSRTSRSSLRSRSPKGPRTKRFDSSRNISSEEQRSTSRTIEERTRGSRKHIRGKRSPEGARTKSSRISSRKMTSGSESSSDISDNTYDSSVSSTNNSSSSRSSYDRGKSRSRRWKPWWHFGYGRHVFSPSSRPVKRQERRSVSVARSKLNFYDKFRFKSKQWIKAQEPEIKAAEQRLIKEIVNDDTTLEETNIVSKESSSELVVATQHLKISKIGETSPIELDSVQLQLQKCSGSEMKLDKLAENTLKGNQMKSQTHVPQENNGFEVKVPKDKNSNELKPIEALPLQVSRAGNGDLKVKEDADCCKNIEISLAQLQQLSVKSKEDAILKSPADKTGVLKVSHIQRKPKMGIKLAKSMSPKKSFWNDKQKRRYPKSFVFSPTKKQTPKGKPPEPGSHRKLVFEDMSSPEKPSPETNKQAEKEQMSSETQNSLCTLKDDTGLKTSKGKEDIKEISLDLTDIPLPQTQAKTAEVVEDSRPVAEDMTNAMSFLRKREVSRETASDHEEVDMDLDEEDSFVLEEDTTWLDPKGTEEAATSTASGAPEASSTDTSQYYGSSAYWSYQGQMYPGVAMGYPQHDYWSSGQAMQYHYDSYYNYKYSGTFDQSTGSLSSSEQPPIQEIQGTSQPPPLPEDERVSKPPALPENQGSTVTPPLPKDNGTSVCPPFPKDNETTVPIPLSKDQETSKFPPFPKDQGTIEPQHSHLVTTRPAPIQNDQVTTEHGTTKSPSVQADPGTTQLSYGKDDPEPKNPQPLLADCLSRLQENLQKISRNQQSSRLLNKERSQKAKTQRENLNLMGTSGEPLQPKEQLKKSPAGSVVVVSSDEGDSLQQKSTSSKSAKVSSQIKTLSPEKLIANLQVLRKASLAQATSQSPIQAVSSQSQIQAVSSHSPIQAVSSQSPIQAVSSQSQAVSSQSPSIHQQSSLAPQLPVPSVIPSMHPLSVVPVPVPVPVPPPQQEHQNTSHLFQSPFLTSLIPPINEIQTPKPVPPPTDFKCASNPLTHLPLTLPNPCAIISDKLSSATSKTTSMKSGNSKPVPKQKMSPSTDRPTASESPSKRSPQKEGLQNSQMTNVSKKSSLGSELHRNTTNEVSSDSTIDIPQSPSNESKDPRLRKSFEQNPLPEGPSYADGQSSSKDSQQDGSKASVQLKELRYSNSPKERSRDLGVHSKYLHQLKSVLTSSLAKSQSKSSSESVQSERLANYAKKTPFIAPLPNFASNQLQKGDVLKTPSAMSNSDVEMGTGHQQARNFSSGQKYGKQRSDQDSVAYPNIVRPERTHAAQISHQPTFDNVDPNLHSIYSIEGQQKGTKPADQSTNPNLEKPTYTTQERQSSHRNPDLRRSYSSPDSTRPSNHPNPDPQPTYPNPFSRSMSQQASLNPDSTRPSHLSQPNYPNQDHQPCQPAKPTVNQPNPDQQTSPVQKPAHLFQSLLSSSAINPSNSINKTSRDPRLQAKAKRQDKTCIATKTLLKTVDRPQSSLEKHESPQPRASHGKARLVTGVTKSPESVNLADGKNTSGILKPLNLQNIYEDGHSGTRSSKIDNNLSDISDGYWKGLGDNDEPQVPSKSNVLSSQTAVRTAADVSKIFPTSAEPKPSPATFASPFKSSPSSAVAAECSSLTASIQSSLTPEPESLGIRPSASAVGGSSTSANPLSSAAVSRLTSDAAVPKNGDKIGVGSSVSTVKTIQPSLRRTNSSGGSSKCSASSTGRRPGPSANIVVPLVDIPKSPLTPKFSNPSFAASEDRSLNPGPSAKPVNESDDHDLEPNIEIDEELPEISTDLPKDLDPEVAMKDTEVSKDSWRSITPMKITKRSENENMITEEPADGMDTSSTLESKSVESDMKRGSGMLKYMNLSSYSSDGQSSLLSEKVRGLSHKDVSEWVKTSSAQRQLDSETSPHRHKKHKEKRRHHSSSSTSPRSIRDGDRSDGGKSSKIRSNKNDPRRLEVSPRSKEFLKSRSVDPSEDSSDFPEAESEGTDPMKTPSKHKLILDTSQLSKLKANFAKSPLLKSKSCPSSQGTKYAPEISNSLGSYKIPKKNSTPGFGNTEKEKKSKNGHKSKGSSKSEAETSPDRPHSSAESDDDLFNETPAFLREFEETSKAILNAPVMNRTVDNSEFESTQSDDSFVLEEGPVQSVVVNKPDKSAFSLDALLAERVENEETERELQFMQKELKEVIKQGGFVRLAEEDVEEDDLLPEHHKKLEYFQVSVNTIQDEHPGDTVLRPGRFPCVYTQTLSPLRCGFQPNNSFIETHLANIQPDALTDLLTTDMLSMCFHLIQGQEQVLRWIFFIMCVHEDSCVVQGCKKLIFDIIHSQMAAEESTSTWAPAVPDVIKVLVNFGGNSKELLGNQRLYSEEEVREFVCPENDVDLVQGQGDMSTRSYAENIREYLQTLAFALQGRPPYSAVELNTLFLMVAKLAMEKELAQNVLLYEFTVVISSLVKCYSNEDWDAVMPGLCCELSEVTSHHHNREYLAQLFHNNQRCTAIQRRLAYLLLYKMLLPGISVNRMQLINFKLRNLAVFFPKLRALAENDLYALYSAICLMDIAVGNEQLKGPEKVDLQYLMELLRTLTSDIRDNVRRLDHTRVKDLMVRISSKWTVTLQITSSKQRNMFAWTKQKSPQKMQVQRLETGASEEEEEEEEEEIVPMEEDGDMIKQDQKPTDSTSENDKNETQRAKTDIEAQKSDCEAHRGENDVDDAKQSSVDSQILSGEMSEDIENRNERTSVTMATKDNLNCNNNAEREMIKDSIDDLSQHSSSSIKKEVRIVLEDICLSGQSQDIVMSSDDESLPELDLTL